MTHTLKYCTTFITESNTKKKENLVRRQRNPETVVCTLHTLEHFFFFLLFLFSALKTFIAFFKAQPQINFS